MLAQRSRTHPSRKRRLASMSGILAVLFLLLLGQGCCNPETPGPPGPTGGKRTPPSDPNPKTGLTGGIPNPHNTCYMNSVLQVIARLYPDVFSGKSSALAQAGQALVDAIKDHKRNATKEEVEAFLDALVATGWPIDGRGRNSQQDPQEFLSHIFDKLSFPGSISLWDINEYTDETGKKQSTKKNSQIHMLMAISGLGREDRSYGNNLQTFVDAYFSEEEIDYEESPTKKSTKTARIQAPSSILAVYARRFGHEKSPEDKSNPQDASEFRPYEAQEHMEKPFALKIKAEHQYANNGTSLKDVSYVLTAFILHIGAGSPNGGHYTAYVRNSEGQWVLYNDISVSTVTPDEAEQRASEAYLYFYKEVGASAAPEP